MNPATQKGKIIRYCAEHGSITIREAFERLNINSPSKRISELRSSPDYIVDSIEETRINSDGETVKFKRYFITQGVNNDGICQNRSEGQI